MDHIEQGILEWNVPPSFGPSTKQDDFERMRMRFTDPRLNALTTLAQDHVSKLTELCELLKVPENMPRQDFLDRKKKVSEFLTSCKLLASPTTIMVWRSESNKVRQELKATWERWKAANTDIVAKELRQADATQKRLEKELKRVTGDVANLMNLFDKLIDRHIRSPALFRPRIQDIDRFALDKKQETLVAWDHDAEARVIGPAGSGKTIVLLHRALRLAIENSGKVVRIFTINRSLAADLKKTLDSLASMVYANLHVESFQDFILACICELRPDEAETLRVHDPHSGEKVADAESWKEFLRSERNPSRLVDALTLSSSRFKDKDAARDYLFEEMTYITSAFSKNHRRDYLSLDRRSRTIALHPNRRSNVLQLLGYWDSWLEDGHLRDPDGWVQFIADEFKNLEFIRKIQEKFPTDFVLVDEAQDFGTLELQVLVRYMSGKEPRNRLFFTGDLRQKVFAKHHDTRAAGLNFQRNKSRRLQKSFRNTRQILEAAIQIPRAYDVQADEEVEVVDPEMSGFKGPKPQVLKVIGSDHVGQLLEIVTNLQRNCPDERIAITSENAELLGELRGRLEWPMLLRNEDVPSQCDSTQDHRHALARMNAVKGFEFDSVIVADLSASAMPVPTRPSEEIWRDAALVYTAMTRARTRLYITYVDKPSCFLEVMRDFVDWDFQDIKGLILRLKRIE